MRRVAARGLVLVLVVVAYLLAPAGPTGPAPAQAHPLGNFTVNHYDGLTLHPDRLDVLAVLDTAEIPTFQRRGEVDADGDGRYSSVEAAAHAAAECAELVSAVAATVDGTALAFTVVRAEAVFPPGDQNLAPTTRVTCELTAPADLSGRATLEFRDAFREDRIGWREITATGAGLRLVESDVPAASISDELRAYPPDLLMSPLDQRSARIVVAPGSGAPGAPALGLPATGIGWLDGAVDAVEGALGGLVGSAELTPWVGAAAVGLALLLGASHAALPGHGKTLIAAYLAGRAGTRRDAVVVGLTVTLTHTGGVLVLGLLVSAVSTFAPEAAIRWLGIASGLLILAIGGWLLVSALRARAVRAGAAHPVPALVGAGHGHGHGHGHAHGHALGHGTAGRDRFGRSSLVGMGVAAGMVPSPTALVVLVAAIALGRTWFGVGLVLAYGVGMAGVLTAVGLLLVMLRDRLVVSRLAEPGRALLARVTAVMPVATALLVIVIGAALAVRGLAVTEL